MKETRPDGGPGPYSDKRPEGRGGGVITKTQRVLWLVAGLTLAIVAMGSLWQALHLETSVPRVARVVVAVTASLCTSYSMLVAGQLVGRALRGRS